MGKWMVAVVGLTLCIYMQRSSRVLQAARGGELVHSQMQRSARCSLELQKLRKAPD